MVSKEKMLESEEKSVSEELPQDDGAAREAEGKRGADAPQEAGGDDAAGDLAAQLAEARQKASDNWERCLRTAAELDNVRKRAARDVEHAHKFGLEKFVREILGVRDNLEMGIAAAPDDDALKAYVDGGKMTLRSLDQVLEKFGVEEIDPTGERFDPERHEAMGARPVEGAESGSVLDVVQKGYALNGRLLRAARVFVAQ